MINGPGEVVWLGVVFVPILLFGAFYLLALLRPRKFQTVRHATILRAISGGVHLCLLGYLIWLQSECTYGDLFAEICAFGALSLTFAVILIIRFEGRASEAESQSDD